jgi:capsular polysaccharide biosynthesis protein
MENEKNSHLDANNNEIDLMDLLLIISNNIKTLLFLPALGAICATAFIFWQAQKPTIFVSKASVSVESSIAKDEAPKARAEVVISAINSGDAFADFKGAVTASLGRADRLVNLSASAESPEKARALNHSALEKIYSITAPSGAEAARLQKLLTAEQQRLIEIHQIISQYEISSETDAKNIRAYGELLQVANSREYSIAKIEHQLSGVSPSNIVLAPTLPESSQPIKKFIPLLLGVTVGGLFAFLWIFTRYGFQLLRRDPRNQAKIALLKANLGLKQ